MMKQVTLVRVLLLLCTISFVGCGNESEKKIEIYPLSFEKEYYEAPLLGSTSISIRGGNRDYTITVEKENILETSIDLSGADMGRIIIKPKQKGETTVSVKDNTTKETVELKVKVIDAYLAYAIKSSNHPALSNQTTIYLINNEAKDCYFFQNDHATPIAKGNYNPFIKLEGGTGDSTPSYAIPYLTLNYASDENGKFTESAIPPTAHHLRFELSESNKVSAILSFMDHYLGIDWKELIQVADNRSIGIPQLLLTMTIDNTNYKIIGTLITIPEIPENILE